MEFLKKYTPIHYNAYLSTVINIINNHDDLHVWLKKIKTSDILIWLKSISYLEKNNKGFFEESCIIVTLAIKLFCVELDIQNANLKNSDIIKLIERLKSSLITELAYRNELIDKTPNYTILKDIKDI